MKLLEDKLDEIAFSEDLMRENFSQRLEDFVEKVMPDVECSKAVLDTFRKGYMSMRLIRR